MNRRHKAFVLLILLCLSAAMAAGCGKKERILTINKAPVYTSSVTQIMKEKNILEKYLPKDVQVEWSGIATGPDIRDAIVAGSVDIGDISMSSYISAHENGLPLRMLSYCGSTPILLYACRESVTSIKDFDQDDKISITNKGTTLHLAFLAQCKKDLGNALAYDNNLVAIPAADAIAALSSGDSFDGAVFSFPMYEKANELSALTLVADMRDVIKEYGIGSVIVVNGDFAEKNQDIVDAFLSAQEEAIDFIINSPEEASEILSGLYGVEKEKIVKVIEEMPPQNKVIGYDKQASLLYECGLLSDEPDKFEDLPNYESIIK